MRKRKAKQIQLAMGLAIFSNERDRFLNPAAAITPPLPRQWRDAPGGNGPTRFALAATMRFA